MIEIHDFKFVMSNSFAVDASIENHIGHFEAEFITPAYQNTGTRLLIRATSPFPDAKAAFDWIVRDVLRYASSQSLLLAWIDNPCNEPFIIRADQVPILSSYGWNGLVLLNGQI